MGYNKAALTAMALSVPLIVVATVLFEKYVDRKSVAVASYCANIYLGKQELRLQPRLEGAKQALLSYAALVYLRTSQIFKRQTETIEPEVE
jgi:hypothetical protein